VRVAEDFVVQQVEVLGELRVRLEAGAGVVEIDVTLRVEPCEVGVAQLLERGSGG